MADKIITKRCQRCKETKPITDFGRNKGRVDGRQDYCKKCRYLANKKYNNTNKGRINHNNNNIRYYKKHPEKYRAKLIIRNAVQYGRIKPAKFFTCSICSYKKAEHYHHPDYSKPFFVIPICHICHRHLHNLINIQGRDGG